MYDWAVCAAQQLQSLGNRQEAAMGKKKKSALQVIMEDGWYHREIISVCMLPNT